MVFNMNNGVIAVRYQFLRFPGGKPKAVTLSYDDGIRDDLRFSDIITGHGFKCTFNYNCGSPLSDDEVQEYVLSRGHEIAVHGAQHRAEGLLRPIEGIREILDCRLALESRFHTIIRGCAYPDSGITRFENGADYQTIRNYLKECDIAYARTLGADNDSFRLPADFLAWMPSVHHSNPKAMEYAEKFLSIDYSPAVYDDARSARLFFMWGHTYEFENSRNWVLLENLCKTLGGKDDIWYATNMEIYSYVEAYHSLHYSADGRILYNPTLLQVWFERDRKLYCIGPGETLTL